MKIAGLQKLTLLDFPGKTAATVFTHGCNFRCPFCHNADLVVGAPEEMPALSPDAFFAFLETRHGLLDGVCITGGEPLLQQDLADFCARIHAQGFAVKLDTNGSLPSRLDELLKAQVVDYVAMDVKNAPARYAETVGLRDVATTNGTTTANTAAAAAAPSATTASVSTPPDKAPLETSATEQSLVATIEKSLRVLAASSVPYEVRTTVVRELHSADDLRELARWLAPFSPTWFLQSYTDSDGVLTGAGHLHAWSADDLHELLPELQTIVPSTHLRGVD